MVSCDKNILSPYLLSIKKIWSDPDPVPDADVDADVDQPLLLPPFTVSSQASPMDGCQSVYLLLASTSVHEQLNRILLQNKAKQFTVQYSTVQYVMITVQMSRV